MRHDGSSSDNQCDPSSYIMSPTLGSGKITWSPCSRSYLQRFLQWVIDRYNSMLFLWCNSIKINFILRTSQSRCLLDHGSSGGQLDHSAEGALPGERFDSNQQCILKYGFGSRHSTQQPLDDICRDMHCERERYTWTSHPALEGTSCGNNKVPNDDWWLFTRVPVSSINALSQWCRGGRCVDKNGLPKHSSSTERVSGVWSAWHISECASGCLYDDHNNLDGGSTGIRVITRTCSTPRYCTFVSLISLNIIHHSCIFQFSYWRRSMHWPSETLRSL